MRMQARHRAESFAAKLIGRYARSGARQRWIELSMPNAAVLATSIVNHYRVALCISGPRSRTVSRWERQAGPRSPVAIEYASETLPTQQRLSSVRSVVQATTLTRIVQRLQRVETRTNHGGPVTSTSTRADSPTTQMPLAQQPSAPAAAEMPLRPFAVAANPSMTQPITSASSSVPRSSPHASVKPASSTMVENELERLADRVISSIDRRIVAQRERFGRP